ncbi:MAG TPA: glycosyltransferase family 2 protein [Acetobacteraceae bacterium]|nr:glycosyltransferase family 2 protein [Acetobacteraceae bacterium]
MFLSVVAPCFNEADNLREFHRRVAAVCEGLGAWELILVNDGSTDTTFDVIRNLVQRDLHVTGVNLARNYGHQIALTAGLQFCTGEHILILDADLQDPPELLDEMLRLMDQQNADVVYGQRRARAGETWFKTRTAALFYRLMRRLVDIDLPMDAGDFRLMTRRTVAVLNNMPEQHRFIRGMVAWIGLRQVPLLYDREPRRAGETHYPLHRMIRLAFDAITGFSVMPLRLASLAGAGVGVIGLLLLTYTLVGWLTGQALQGWTSMTSLMLILGGAQLMLLGIFGEYLGRLYIEVKRRPLFVVDRVLTNAATNTKRVTPDMASILSRTHGRANEQETNHEIRDLL